MSEGQNLAEGAAGIALLHLETGDREAAYAALHEAVSAGVSVAAGASLYYGAPALAFVLAAFDRPGLTRAKFATAAGTATVTRRRLDAAHRRIDQRQRPAYAEFDLIRGLTGLGVALRRIDAVDLLAEVLTYLVRLTEPIDGLPGWWCPTGPNRDIPGPAEGHSNHGMAHGITGPLALMALTMSDGIHVDGQPAAVTRICQWLDHWERQTEGGHAWWPEIITLDELHRDDTVQPGPLRPSWCYGTPGIARAQQLAARALGDIRRQRKAATAFAACVSDPEQLARLTCRGLCHGTGGLLATGRRIAADALTPTPVPPLLNLHWQAAATPDEPPGFLDGTAGAELVTTGIATSWDACLLLC
ncbi:lanthionine synthetase C family protein [Actinomadura sp. 7K507]|uniref:lanthionine synthetase C family protein n=1 Tax=Actinomadura sp. 7K507 TaxID=2530365 RepID=UPI00104965B5|nr:lanthionine synthetase C family protein [Actinomadura sp. 7K507]TDC79198.1 lanthionine synthetase [Actinomadura sp. 7K507]